MDRITGVHHIKITIPSDGEARARWFYCDLLGLCEVPKPETLQGRGGFWLDAVNLLVYVGLEDGVSRDSKAHIGYAVADLDFWRSRLEVAGVTIRESLPVPGHERFEVLDPFGNRIEIQRV